MISALLATVLLAVQHQHQHVPGHSFDDTERWVAEFESPERDRQQKPDEVVAAIGTTTTSDEISCSEHVDSAEMMRSRIRHNGSRTLHFAY